MTTLLTKPHRWLTWGWILLLALGCAPAAWAEDTPPPGLRPETISAGYWHTCGLKSDGTVVCWGYNYDGQASPPAGAFTQVSTGDITPAG